MELTLRFATIRDIDTYFEWANDEEVRKNSFHSDAISYENHVAWFKNKLLNPDSFLYFFTCNQQVVGQVRIEVLKSETIIGISVDKNFRGKSLSTPMLQLAASVFFEYHPQKQITAYIKQENISSYKSFKNAGFEEKEMVIENGFKSYKLIKTNGK